MYRCISTLLIAGCALLATCALADEAQSISYDGMATGLDFKTFWVGTYPRPYESDKRDPGGTVYKRLGGLAWELDVTDGPPHVCGRTVPGFRHSLIFEQAGLDLQRVTHYDLGSIAPTGATLSPPEKQRNWTNYTMRWNYAPAGQQAQAAELSVTFSRLTPAVLVNCTGPQLTLFGGPQNNWVRNKFLAETLVPKGLAMPADGGMKIVSPDKASDLPLATLGESWLLLWWGPRVQTSDSHDPSLSGWPHNYEGNITRRDIPILVIFERAPPVRRAGREGRLGHSIDPGRRSYRDPGPHGRRLPRHRRLGAAHSPAAGAATKLVGGRGCGCIPPASRSRSATIARRMRWP